MGHDIREAHLLSGFFLLGRLLMRPFFQAYNTRVVLALG